MVSKSKILSTVAALSVAALSFGQQGAFGVPTNFSGSFLIQRKSSLLVVQIPIKTWASKNPKITYSFDGLGGYNASQTQGAIGTDIAFHYRINPNFSLVLGLGTTVPTATFTLSQVNKNNVGLLIGGAVNF